MKHISFLLIFLLLFSCYSELDFEFPEKDQKIVVNSVVKSDSIFKVRIARSYPGYEQSLLNYPYLDDATVSLYADGEKLEVLESIDWGIYRSTTGIKPQEGVNYSLEVEHENFENVKTSAYLPPQTSTSLSNVTKTYDSSANGYYFNYTLNIHDAPGKNYYWLKVKELKEGYGDTEDIDQFNLTIEDELFDYKKMVYSDYDIFYVFEDTGFDGKSRSIKFKSSDEGTQYIVVEFHNITEDFYLYMKSINNFYSVSSSTKNDPPVIYTNVEKGFGIFGGTHVTYDTLYIINLD